MINIAQNINVNSSLCSVLLMHNPSPNCFKNPFPRLLYYLSLKCRELDSAHVTNITLGPFWSLTK